MSTILKDVTNGHAKISALPSISPSQREKPDKAMLDALLFALPLPRSSITEKEDAVGMPISPDEASAELTGVYERLLRLIQGMSAWTATRAPLSNDARIDAVWRKMWEVEALLAEARVLHGEQEPLVVRKAHPVEQALTPAEKEAEGRPLTIFQLPNGPSLGGLLSSTPVSVGRRPAATPSRRPLSKSKFSYGSMAWPPSVSCWIVVVEFKRQRMQQCLSEGALDPGTYVIVPGDRGYDCGLVVQCGVWNPALAGFEEGTLQTMDGNPIPITRMKGDLMAVLREATTEEVHQLYADQASKERLALKTCRELVQKLNLDMIVMDCEYQFDGTKISFYFEANRSIDFRDLNKELFRIFNARIWMENVNNCVKNVIPEGAMSKSDKIQYRTSGLRIPPH